MRSAIDLAKPKQNGGDTLVGAEEEQVRRATKILGIERKTLYRKIERMGLG